MPAVGYSGDAVCTCCTLDAIHMTHINILAELYMHTGAFEATHALVMRTSEALRNAMVEVGGRGHGDQNLELS